jgi:hypothetical protein
MSLPAFPSTGQPLQSFASLCAASLLTVSALCPGTARAQAGAACDPQSTAVASLNACAVQHFQEVDTAQNILYADVMRALSAHERPALRQDQPPGAGSARATARPAMRPTKTGPTGRRATTAAWRRPPKHAIPR